MQVYVDQVEKYGLAGRAHLRDPKEVWEEKMMGELRVGKSEEEARKNRKVLAEWDPVLCGFPKDRVNDAQDSPSQES